MRNRFREEWLTVKVSARILRWPQQCACCNGPCNSHLTVSHTRLIGVKVIRDQTKTWDIPYCSHCLVHVNFAESALQVKEEAEAISTNEKSPLGPTLLCALLIWGLLLWSSIQWCIALLVAGLCSILIWCSLGRQYTSERKKSKSKRVAKMADAKMILEKSESHAQARCCDLGPAAAYDGWEGSVHMFRFKNLDFVNAFIFANGSKVLR